MKYEAYTQGPLTGAYLLEDFYNLSREKVVFAQGYLIQAGQVLGKITETGKYAPLDFSATDGRETAYAISYDTVDTTDEEQVAVITARLSAAKIDYILWPETATDQQIETARLALQAHHIVLR
ncbi:head decoration protein [Bartonella sp. DGB2]|uniref:head decoration protein n=1 Tax=Bartonella sp. DGB2 TaxID=3388426 RepID=UPI00398FE47B